MNNVCEIKCAKKVRKVVVILVIIAFLMLCTAIGLSIFYTAKIRCGSALDMNLGVDWDGFHKTRNELQEKWIRKVIPNVYALVLPGRMGKFIPIMLSLKIDPDIITAKKPSQIKKDTSIPIHKQLQNEEISPETCCLLGHYKMMKRYLDEGKQGELALFFEDDLAIPEDFGWTHKTLTRIVKSDLSAIKEPFICYLGSCKVAKGKQVAVNLYRGSALCCHAYILNLEAAKMICTEYLKNYKTACDNLLRRMTKTGKLKSFIVMPVLFKQNKGDFGTYIGNALGDVV